MGTGHLIFFCGKMGAGKSTNAQRITNEMGVVLLSEDEWLAKLYPDEIKNFQDYIKYSSRLKPLVAKHVVQLLKSGNRVIMDFPGNTKKQREYFKAIINNTQCTHKLIYLRADDSTCLQRLQKRRISSPERAVFDTEEVFRIVTGFFEEPKVEEGFTIEMIDQS